MLHLVRVVLESLLSIGLFDFITGRIHRHLQEEVSVILVFHDGAGNSEMNDDQAAVGSRSVRVRSRM